MGGVRIRLSVDASLAKQELSSESACSAHTGGTASAGQGMFAFLRGRGEGVLPRTAHAVPFSV